MNVSQNNATVISRPALAFSLSTCLVTMIIGAVCNFFVIFTILKTRSLRQSSINRAVLNLCCADLITVCLDVPLMSMILITNYRESDVSYIRTSLSFLSRAIHSILLLQPSLIKAYCFKKLNETYGREWPVKTAHAQEMAPLFGSKELFSSTKQWRHLLGRGSFNWSYSILRIIGTMFCYLVRAGLESTSSWPLCAINQRECF